MFVITLNPKTVDFDEIIKLCKRGFNAYRVNFARNKLERNLELIYNLKQCRCTVFIDLPGEKNRIIYRNSVKLLERGDIITLKISQAFLDDEYLAMIDDDKILKFSKLDDVFIIGDSNVKLRVIELSSNQIKLACISPGKLYNGAGLNIENKYLEKRHLCNIDREIIKSLNFDNVDFLCISFADCSAIVNEARNLIPYNAGVKLIAKIESPIGIKNLRSILPISDGILLARSDLSKFYNLIQLSKLSEHFKSLINDNKYLIFASNYFLISNQNHKINEMEKQLFKHDFDLNPNFIYINETYYSASIKEVIDFYLKCAN